MDSGYITTVTINEFLVWYSTGELRIHRSRLLPIVFESIGIPKKDETISRQMVEKFPYVDLEDEHNILLVTLGLDPIVDTNQTGVGNFPLAFDMAYVAAESILSIQPLTLRGADIIKSRLSDLDLHLEQPMFENETNELWLDWSLRRSIRGAETIIKLSVKEPSFKPSTEFMKQAEEALSLINAQKEAAPHHSLLVKVMCYSRHDHIPEQDIGFLIDLGIILSQYEEALPEIQPVVNSMRQICRDFIKNNDSRKLTELLVDSDLKKIFDRFFDKHKTEIDLETAALFLKWKHLMQRIQRLDIRSVLNDVRGCPGRVTKLNVEKALWLFGFYCGFDRMAKDYYMRAEYGRYRFVKKRVTNEPVEFVETIVKTLNKKEQTGVIVPELKGIKELEEPSQENAEHEILKRQNTSRNEESETEIQTRLDFEKKYNMSND